MAPTHGARMAAAGGSTSGSGSGSAAKPGGGSGTTDGSSTEPKPLHEPNASGFTKAQLDCLKSQILAFRKLKKGDGLGASDLGSGVKPLPLPPHLLTPHTAPAALRRDHGPLFALAASGPVPKTERRLAADAISAQYPHALSQRELAVCAVQHAQLMAATTAQHYHAMQQPRAVDPAGLTHDVPNMMVLEYQRQMKARRKKRQADLEAALADPNLEENTVQGLVPRVGDKRPARGGMLFELRKLRLLEFQTKLRKAVEAEQQQLVQMPERQYRRWQVDSKKLRLDLARAEQYSKDNRQGMLIRDGRQMKSAMGDRAALLSSQRAARNKAIGRLHDRMAREHTKVYADDAARRLEALKANDIEAYKEMLKQQKVVGGETEEERFNVISEFLQETERYLEKLAAKVAEAKHQAALQQHIQAAMEDARRAGGSDGEVAQAMEQAGREFQYEREQEKAHAGHGGTDDAHLRYYELAHSIKEEVTRQPVLLRPPDNGVLRDYQIIGLNWMVSLYNNHLNGILADEMGLGKTVQVMALIAYLMEHKSNCGPHLIIVPNAVMVNWKSELIQWLPTVRCVYYVGGKEERARLYQTDVQPALFNVLVTTYEFIMRDRAKLCKLDWKYIIIDEAQRLKERDSKLAKDLGYFRAQRRLLLTGTPLQNELRELWNLLNLLLPEVFDDKKQFSDWFDSMLSASETGDATAQQLANEKKLVVVHRLHQILVPFMLRRQVQDVEGKLPPKVPVVVKVAMPAYQAAIYNWVKVTGTIRLFPTDPRRFKGGQQGREYAALNNKVMEMRKVCNHPLLTYTDDNGAFNEMVIRQCGKMLVLDRILVKFVKTGHRVLLFSTMTKLLDLLQEYLKWRELPSGKKTNFQRIDSATPSSSPRFSAQAWRELPGGKKMNFRRIDGATPLEMRETAIKEFNAPGSEVFVFLLSIRAAGRGLNLQTSDTVIIYDPDHNPKNEEQAIARSHRIGQKKEVRVIHLEAIADQVEADKGTTAAAAVMREQHRRAAEPGGTRMLYKDSVESLTRNVIQKQKIDMANEVIDAGRFDAKTTNEDRHKNLEALLHDEERLLMPTNTVFSWEELNKQLARGEGELEEFNRIDREYEWFDPLDELPAWLSYNEADVKEAQDVCQKHLPSKTGILSVQQAQEKGVKPTKAFNPWVSSGGGDGGGRGRGRGRGGRGGATAPPRLLGRGGVGARGRGRKPKHGGGGGRFGARAEAPTARASGAAAAAYRLAAPADVTHLDLAAAAVAGGGAAGASPSAAAAAYAAFSAGGGGADDIDGDAITVSGLSGGVTEVGAGDTVMGGGEEGDEEDEEVAGGLDVGEDDMEEEVIDGNIDEEYSVASRSLGGAGPSDAAGPSASVAQILAAADAPVATASGGAGAGPSGSAAAAAAAAAGAAMAAASGGGAGGQHAWGQGALDGGDAASAAAGAAAAAAAAAAACGAAGAGAEEEGEDEEVETEDEEGEEVDTLAEAMLEAAEEAEEGEEEDEEIDTLAQALAEAADDEGEGDEDEEEDAGYDEMDDEGRLSQSIGPAMRAAIAAATGIGGGGDEDDDQDHDHEDDEVEYADDADIGSGGEGQPMGYEDDEEDVEYADVADVGAGGKPEWGGDGGGEGGEEGGGGDGLGDGGWMAGLAGSFEGAHEEEEP
ncbi:hypothetical protein FOA52_008011 [Chlamydomonas sp. UWO 241]|nr:hypothetical protein FOA52_008011 [Chlamydomonas sp. UWO 241]